VTNTLGVMAANRRLFVLPGMIAAVKGLIAEARGEVTAEVTRRGR
jgi:F-type H+-transporting ATPase subunit delta